MASAPVQLCAPAQAHGSPTAPAGPSRARWALSGQWGHGPQTPVTVRWHGQSSMGWMTRRRGWTQGRDGHGSGMDTGQGLTRDRDGHGSGMDTGQEWTRVRDGHGAGMDMGQGWTQARKGHSHGDGHGIRGESRIRDGIGSRVDPELGMDPSLGMDPGLGMGPALGWIQN